METNTEEERSVIELAPFSALTKAEKGAVADAAERYGKFLGLSALLV
jgi:hypothetical protein